MNDTPKQSQHDNGTAPDAETQSSADSAQGQRNNADRSIEKTGADASTDKAEGGRTDASADEA